ncbi:MAG: hypothetical protein JSW12_17340 [Deltaproteobacteria bacterium]|nr:MAG: hypothetical protein JSW12_17340 [Deltaproteobacteria bacterium]
MITAEDIVQTGVPVRFIEWTKDPGNKRIVVEDVAACCDLVKLFNSDVDSWIAYIRMVATKISPKVADLEYAEFVKEVIEHDPVILRNIERMVFDLLSE